MARAKTVMKQVEESKAKHPGACIEVYWDTCNRSINGLAVPASEWGAALINGVHEYADLDGAVALVVIGAY